jgi:GNAT superfamily N-acetyltransferase
MSLCRSGSLDFDPMDPATKPQPAASPEAPPVTLAPMTQPIYDAWRDRSVREYAAGHVAAGNWPAEGSLARAGAAFDELLPDGLATAGQQLWSIRDSGGAHVGILWVGPRPNVPDALWIWDIMVEPEARGRGHGQAALEALHAWARDHGYGRVGLHVFASNDVARRLYRRVGYVETDVTMEKRL